MYIIVRTLLYYRHPRKHTDFKGGNLKRHASSRMPLAGPETTLGTMIVG
jgi:hypothetical protein